MKANLRNNEATKRTDSYTVDPRVIKIDWDANPRKDYGTAEEQQELMDSIQAEGVLTPLFVYIDKKDNSLNLAHGFRRMRAITNLIEAGLADDLTAVPIKQIEYNMETIMQYHLTLNNGKPLSDVEISYTLAQLFKYSGEDYNIVAKKANMSYQKVYNLINYRMSATTQSISMVEKGEISLSNAMDIAKQSNGSDEQNETLETARKNATSNGRTKIKPEDIKGVALSNNKKFNAFKVVKGYFAYLKSVGIQDVSIEDINQAIELAETGVSVDDMIENYVKAEA